MDIDARFMKKVEFEANTGCWLWTGYTNRGYGRFGYRGENCLAHRVSFLLFRGETDQHLDHLCRTRQCVNPAHLEPVTQAENNRRAAKYNYRTHCRRGHPFSGANVRMEAHGKCRVCRECKRMRNRIYKKGGKLCA